MKYHWVSSEEWEASKRGDDCEMCYHLQTNTTETPHGFIVAELERGVLQLQKNQNIRGYCLLIAKKHVTEPFQMHEQERRLFFEDMVNAAEAMQQVFQPAKMNYEMLGNMMPHLHVHLKPRYLDDAAPHRRIPSNSKNPHLLSGDEYQQIIGDVREALGFIRVRVDDPLLVNLLDNQGRVTRWPTLKFPEEQMAVREYLASKFEYEREYTEREVNDLLNVWHTFGDWALLRRELFMHELLGRMKNGSCYWRKAERTRAG
jgi:diadenosine tetraphosphate (Ap4A) HIT family hydrolase